MRNRRWITVLIIAGLVRAGFLIGTWGGVCASVDTVMVRHYLRDGYAMAAGYGYIEGDGSAGEHLWGLYERVKSGNMRVTPEVAGALPREGARPVTLHPPGMALLVAWINLVLGIRADVPIQLLGLVLDCLAAGLLYRLVSTSLSERVGYLAGLLYAMFPPLAFASISKMPDGFLSLFVLATLACFLQTLRIRGRRVVGWCVISGLALGLGCYLRPDYLYLPVFLGLGLWVCTRRLIRAVGTALLVQVVALAVLLPWAYRNHSLCGRWIFTSTALGGVLINGLGSFHNPWGFGYTDEDRTQEAAAQGIPSSWTPEADLYFRSLFWQSIKAQPRAYALSILRRLPLVLAPPYDCGYANPWKTQSFTEHRKVDMDRYEVLGTRPLYVLAAYWDRLLMGAVSLLSLAGVMALFIGEWRRAGLVLLLLCPHVYSIVAHLPVFVTPRFILPSMFCWLIGLAYLLSRGWRHTPDEGIPR
jgi:4-amino-4-deoxy-L-arabinose transferase-like glycosyltransferase